MTVEHAIYEQWKLVWVKITDAVTFDQMVAYLTALSRDPRYRSPMNKLVDFRMCHQYNLTREEAEKFAALNRELAGYFQDEKCAVVAPRDLEYGMSRAHEMYISGSGLDMQVFRQLPEALDWLGIESSEFR